MKLNPDCIRDILLYVEESTDLANMLSVDSGEVPDQLVDYTSAEIMYHIKQAELSGLIYVASWYMDGSCLIRYLLPSGHQFLANIREDTTWNKTKEIAQKVGSNSLDAIKQIASSVVVDSGCSSGFIITSIHIVSSAIPGSLAEPAMLKLFKQGILSPSS